MSGPRPGAGLSPVRHALDNGGVVIVQPTATTPAVSLNLTLRAGSLLDSPDALGTAFFLSRVIDRGTATHETEAIAETLDAAGVSLTVSVSRHTFTLACTCLAEDFRDVLALLASIVREPSLPPDEVEVRRGEVLTTIRQADDSPAVRAVEQLMAMLYGAEHPYGRRSKGTVDSVRAIDRDTLARFHHAHIVPTALALVIVGDVTAEAAVDAAATALGSWDGMASPEPALEPPSRPAARGHDAIRMPGKSQADIAYGFTTITRDDPRYHAYVVMTNILGQYGMGGRLGHTIREQQGMAYYAFASFEASRVAGPLVVRAGVNRDNVDRTIEAIDGEMARLAADGVTDDELRNTQRYLVGALPRTLETNAAIATFLQNVEQFDLGLDYAQRVPDLIEAVTRDAVAAAAHETLDPERAMVVVAGP